MITGSRGYACFTSRKMSNPLRPGILISNTRRAVVDLPNWPSTSSPFPASAVSLTRKLSRDGGNAEELIRDSMAKASEITAQFPRLHARLQTAAAAGYGAAPDNTFEFGLQTILDGLQAQLTARRTPAGQNAHATQPRPRATRRT